MKHFFIPGSTAVGNIKQVVLYYVMLFTAQLFSYFGQVFPSAVGEASNVSTVSSAARKDPPSSPNGILSMKLDFIQLRA